MPIPDKEAFVYRNSFIQCLSHRRSNKSPWIFWGSTLIWRFFLDFPSDHIHEIFWLLILVPNLIKILLLMAIQTSDFSCVNYSFSARFPLQENGPIAAWPAASAKWRGGATACPRAAPKGRRRPKLKRVRSVRVKKFYTHIYIFYSSDNEGIKWIFKLASFT